MRGNTAMGAMNIAVQRLAAFGETIWTARSFYGTDRLHELLSLSA